MGIESIAQNLQMSSLQQQVSTNQNSVVSDNMKANTDLNDRAQKAEGAARTQAIAEEMVSEEELKKAVDEMNSTMQKYEVQDLRFDLKFGFDDPTKTLFVSLINQKTQESVAQFPGKEALKLRAFFREQNDKFLTRDDFFADLKGKLFNVSN